METSIPLKKCSKCKQFKPETSEYFYTRKGKFRAECHECAQRYRDSRKELLREYNRMYRASHVDELRERKHKYYIEHQEQSHERTRRHYLNHREQIRQRNRSYYIKHAVELRDKSRRYRAINVDRIRAAARAYNQAHQQEKRTYNQRYYACNSNRLREYARNYSQDHREQKRVYLRSWYAKHPEHKRVAINRRRMRKLQSVGAHTAADIRLQVKAQTDKRGRLHCWWCGKVIHGKTYHVDHRIPLAKGGSNGAENLVITHSMCNLKKSDKLPSEFMGRLL